MIMNAIKRRYQHIQRLIHDARASTELSRMKIGYTPWTKMAMRPATVLGLLNEIAVNDRRTVVEFGAGISTVYLAKILSARGGTLLSIEDNAEWAKIVNLMLVSEDLEGSVQLVVAPLKRCSVALNELEWYDEVLVQEALVGQSFDLAIVDGPKANKPSNSLSRYPAFRAVAQSLANRCAIVLDDSQRPGEQEVLMKWLSEMDSEFSMTQTLSGYAICRRGRYFISELL